VRAAALSTALLCAACASGPRPMPPGLSPAERLAFSEAALQQAKNASATFEIEATGSVKARLSGTLQLVDVNALSIVAEGTFAGDPVRVELDSRQGDVNRSTSKGAEVSAHHDPPAPALTDAVAVGLTRMGLLHNLARLVTDQSVDHAQGGAGGWVKAVDIKEGGPDSSGNEACHRVDFVIEVNGARSGETNVCLSDVTALPLQRRVTVHFDSGDMSVVETLRWTLK
jgi:hypothetical protein